ncbi:MULTISPECIES: GNAT family N-acetyltransferase [Vibrio]|uniref:N-acetyltransferase n=1 Tax=Vibrio algicola TaxID=2662262 RepID=A0A5Q0TBL9_9VIBR|nr:MULTISPECIES: GNAT family N-acetyltransferase [Vibrio]MBD1575038.1 N-acetyltransferase [Vibrio sp. S11_S32]
MANFTHDPKVGRYQVEVVSDHWAHLDYHRNQNTLVITHTFVPDELRGQGCGKILMETVLADIDATGHKILPVCPFVEVYIQRHPQWQHLLTD